MTMEITFPGGDRVNASYRGRTIATDQEGSDPRPFDLFLASIGTCSGIYVARFCRQRGIDPTDIRIEQRMIRDPETRMVRRIDLDIRLPEGFPERYRAAVIRAAGLCSVKKHLESAPEIDVRVSEHTLSSSA